MAEKHIPGKIPDQFGSITVNKGAEPTKKAAPGFSIGGVYMAAGVDEAPNVLFEMEKNILLHRS